jgi:DNA-binding NarL/FixJ family response regulator
VRLVADERGSNRAATGRVSDDDVRILAGMASGRVPEAVARDVGISERTLRRRLRRICDDLEVKTPIEAVIWAVRHGLI